VALTYDQISAITEKRWMPKLVDNIFDSDPLLQRLKKKGRYKKVSGGTSLMLPLNYALNSSGGWYSGADTLSTEDNDTITAAEFQWKQLYENITIKRDDELKNKGDAAKLDFVKSKMQICEKTMTDRLQDGLYSSGTDSKSIVGLGVFASTSNTVGGISQSTYSWWQAQVDSTTSTLTIPAMHAVYSDCTFDGKGPSVLLGNRDEYDSYHGLLQPQERYTDAKTASGGFENLMFKGKPFILAPKVTSGQILMINEEAICLTVQKDEDFRFSKFQEPLNQNVKVAKIYFMGAFGIDQCRTLGAMTGL